MTRGAEYQATYRQRTAFNAQAALLGWTKLDVLGSYLTPDGELIVLDKAGNRYSTTGEAEALAPLEPKSPALSKLIEAAPVPVEEFGPRWNASRQKTAEALAQADLDGMTRDYALKVFEDGARVLLAGVHALRTVGGPEWREQLGLGPDEEVLDSL